MNHSHIGAISAEMNLDAAQTSAVASLLDDGATVPFIARYRKEATGSLDEVAVAAIRDRLIQLQELDSRRESILSSLQQHGHLTEDLEAQVMAADTMTRLEDIYLPYRPKRRTKATIAREKGLEPLALAILAQDGSDPAALAADYVDPEKKVDSVDDALAGARDIIAETINEDPQARSRVRDLFSTRRSSAARWWPAKRAKEPSTRIISNGKRPWQRRHPIGFWPCAVAKKKTSWACPSPRSRNWPSPF
jgi:uncharacterized protein